MTMAILVMIQSRKLETEVMKAQAQTDLKIVSLDEITGREDAILKDEITEITSLDGTNSLYSQKEIINAKPKSNKCNCAGSIGKDGL